MMKVSEVCTRNAFFCRPWSNLAEVGGWMWEHDCGALPVVDFEQRVVGILTDRDVAIALATRNVPASQLLVSEVCRWNASCCPADAPLSVGLERMKSERIRRLPVLDSQGQLVGVLSLSDLLRCAQPVRKARSVDLTLEDVAQALRAINFGARSLAPFEPERFLAVAP